MNRTFGVTLSLLLVGSAIACDEKPSPPHASAFPPPEAAAASARTLQRPQAVPQSKALLDLPISAYSAGIFPRGEELWLVSPSLLLKLRGEETLEKRHLDLGRLQVLLEQQLVFVRGDALWTLSLEDFAEKKRLSLPRPPQALVAAGPRVAWTARGDDGKFLLQGESAGSVVTFFSSSEELSSPAFHDEAVFFLKRTGKGWQVGRAPLDGTQASFGAEHESRIPPQLVVGPAALYYYDGPDRGVRKLSFDLDRDESHAPGLICSPLVVTSRAICAQVGGLVDIPHDNADPRTLSAELGGPIAALAATEDQAYWIADRGRDRMSLRTTALPEL